MRVSEAMKPETNSQRNMSTLTEKKTDALSIPQGSLVTPLEPIAFGRCKAHPGQTFWVTCPAYSRPARQFIGVARSGRNAGAAVHMTFADFERFFSVVSDFTA